MRRLPALLALAAVVLAGCAPGGLRPDQAAVVNGTPVTVDELTGRVAATRAVLQRNPQPTSAPPDGATLTRQTLADMIRTRLVLAGAGADGITVSDAQLEQRLGQVRTQVEGRGRKLEEAMAAEGLTDAALRDQLRFDLAATGIATRLVPSPTDAQVRAELTSRRSAPKSVEARHILVADEATAARIRSELASGGDWKALASRFSTDPGSKGAGGELGQLSKGQTVPEFDEALFELAGQGSCKGAKGPCASPISQPVRTSFGWHVLQVMGVTPLTAAESRALTPAAVRAELEQGLQERRQQAFSDWLRELALESEVKVNPRFGSWQAASLEISDRDTAPQAPPTSTSLPTIQLGGDDPAGQAPAAP